MNKVGRHHVALTSFVINGVHSITTHLNTTSVKHEDGMDKPEEAIVTSRHGNAGVPREASRRFNRLRYTRSSIYTNVAYYELGLHA